VNRLFTKEHPNTSKNIQCFAVFGFLDQFAFFLIDLDLSTPIHYTMSQIRVFFMMQAVDKKIFKFRVSKCIFIII
jgi:hypothetical protein